MLSRIRPDPLTTGVLLANRITVVRTHAKLARCNNALCSIQPIRTNRLSWQPEMMDLTANSNLPPLQRNSAVRK